MKLSKVINMELALDRRGKSPIRDMYREVLPWLKWVEEEQTYELYPSTGNPGLVEMITSDLNLVHHLGMVSRVIKEKAGNYYFPKEFLQALSKLDRGIPIDYLPEKFWGYFEFADSAIGDDAGGVKSAYVFVGKMKNFHSREGKFNDGDVDRIIDPEETIISLSYLNDSDATTKFMWPLSNGKKMSEMATEGLYGDDMAPHITEDGLKYLMTPSADKWGERASVIVACLNAVLYLTSDDPELVKIIPEKVLKDKNRKKQRKQTNWENLCTVPLTLVNQSYKDTEKKYHMDGSWWSTHLRWQPCGVGRKTVKLVWVKGHRKNFNKEIKEE